MARITGLYAAHLGWFSESYLVGREALGTWQVPGAGELSPTVLERVG